MDRRGRSPPVHRVLGRRCPRPLGRARRCASVALVVGERCRRRFVDASDERGPVGGCPRLALALRRRFRVRGDRPAIPHVHPGDRLACRPGAPSGGTHPVEVGGRGEVARIREQRPGDRHGPGRERRKRPGGRGLHADQLEAGPALAARSGAAAGLPASRSGRTGGHPVSPVRGQALHRGPQRGRAPGGGALLAVPAVGSRRGAALRDRPVGPGRRKRAARRVGPAATGGGGLPRRGRVVRLVGRVLPGPSTG